MTANQNEKEVETLSTEPNNPIVAKTRINPLAHYLLALAAIVAAYSAYTKFLVPVIEGPPLVYERRETPSIAELSSPRDEKSHFESLLPADAWEMTDCQRLLIDAGTILFKELERQPDGSLRVTPFTLITGMESKTIVAEPETTTSKSPTVLRCVQGATLKFNRPIQDVFTGGAKLEAARLTGKVDIYRPPSDASKNDALHIVTSNIQVNNRRIYTLEKVEFSFGPNRGVGRNMMIDLDHDSKSSALPDFSNINGVRRIELAFLDRLRIEPTKETKLSQIGYEGPVSDKTGNAKPKLFAGNKSPLEISCQGPFVFDFRSQTASFEKQVVARQDDAFNDQINCEKLTLTFKDKPIAADIAKLKLNQPLAPNVKAKPSTDLELKEFVAEGSPAIVVSRSRSAQVSGSYLSYNVGTNEIVGHCDSAGQNPVTIVSPEYQLVAQQLNYVIPEDGSLGQVNAIGSGRLLRIKTPTQDEFFTTWQKGLTTRPILETPGLHRIVVDGSAKIRIANDTRVDADRVEILVWQSANLVTDAQGKVKREWVYQPSKLFTAGNVNIVSPKLDGQAEHLTATWPEIDQQMSGFSNQIHQVGYRGTWQEQLSQNQAAPNRLARIQNQTYTRSQIANQESGFVELGQVTRAGFQENVVAKKPKSKLKFTGETVDVRLIGSGDKTQIRDLTVVGNVTIVNQPLQTLEANPDPTKTPMTITGHRLQLTPQSREGNYRTLITGQNGELATVTAKDFVLKGQNINLDQDANKVWVEGEGSMKMEIASEPKQPAQNSGGAPASLATQNLNVAWKGGMIFDGAQVYFERDVVMSADRPDEEGNQSNIQSLSEGLSVTLTKGVDFQNMGSNQKKIQAKIRELVFVDKVPEAKQRFKLVSHAPESDTANARRPVVIENRTYSLAGQLLEQQKIVVPNAVIKVEAGSIKSKGPGSIATHRWTDPTQRDDKPNPFGQIGNSGNKTGISFVQVNFDGELNVDKSRSEMVLTRNIRTVYSPVQNWDATLNPDMPRQRGPGAVYLTCEKLQLAQWAPRGTTEKSNEMIASGNAHILSDEFEATADRVSYSQASDLLVLAGSARNNATLRQNGSSTMTGKKFTYQIKEQRLSAEAFSGKINRN